MRAGVVVKRFKEGFIGYMNGILKPDLSRFIKAPRGHSDDIAFDADR